MQINNHFSVVFNNTRPEIENNQMNEKINYLEKEMFEICRRLDEQDYEEEIAKQIEAAGVDQVMLIQSLRDEVHSLKEQLNDVN